ncbi:MAG: sulfotransferase domain-containing protein [Chloroflexi bacterium]|nr:sulfotransferase domain-containing protein [Chloroflexota bacterium]
MKRPNFLIIGAPRCGTTALYTYLGEHPNIFLPKVKELHYFAHDFPDLQKVLFRSVDEYMLMFSDAGDRHLAVGEVSPLYYYSKCALSNIREFDAKTKIIFILRNPVDFVQSVHQLNLGLLREDIPDLAKAWELQEIRKHGNMIPKSCRAPELVQYGEMGLFGKYVERVFEFFPHEQVLIILFDDFAASPKSVYETILAFLGIPSDGRQYFPRINANYENRSKFLSRIIHPPQSIYRPFMKVISLFGVNLMENLSIFYKKIEMFNSRRTPRSSIEPALRRKLQLYFREDIQKLAKLINRDLSKWLADQ